MEGANKAVVLRAATPEATTPSTLAELAGRAKSWCQRQGWSFRPARRLCTSICGSTTWRRSPRDLLAQSELGIPLAQLKLSWLTFHLFGKKGNSHREPIWFEVVDITSPYHALLGRPPLAKFMAVPHYTYLKIAPRT
jgi:hypothetical protein